MDLERDLNESQREAVEATEGPTLVIAGAGSGKTRVLTYRVARLLERGVPGWRVLALTFTNKAAREMERRVAGLVGEERARGVWMGTFHAMFARILRAEAGALGFTPNFTIYDAQDARNLARSVVKELGLDEKVYKANEVMGRISMAKNNLVTAEAYGASARIAEADRAARRPRMAEVYRRYDERCRQGDVMDFDDLLLRTNILFRDFPGVLERYQRRFDYILVDEYQDTNYAQYLIVKRLGEVHRNVCVVGDDAQSIYSFRGARIENILNFRNDYPDYRLCKLERNYRSTRVIVGAANSVIAKNREQIRKEVYSLGEEGERVRVRRAMTDREEGAEVAREARRLAMEGGEGYGSVAVLYRTNAQSRALEEGLRRAGVPYRVYGGLSFYQRKEVKDVLGYLRLVVNEHDEEALRRVINYPRRGIGETTVERLAAVARERGVSLWTAVKEAGGMTGLVNGTTGKRLRDFAEMMERFREKAKEGDAWEVAKEVVTRAGIASDLEGDDTPEGVSRRENVQELLSGVRDFRDTARREGEDAGLGRFLAGVALLTDQDREDDGEERVTLMTVHSAKGLEFPTVMVTGMEEDLFPGQQSASTAEGLEEERRLFYVALTRAERRVVLWYAASRYRNGNVVYPRPSRFLGEIDPRFVVREDEREERWREAREEAARRGAEARRGLTGGVTRRGVAGGMARAAAGSGATVGSEGKRVEVPEVDAGRVVALRGDEVAEGMVVYHPTFGAGRVTGMEGRGVNGRARVWFSRHGEKVLLLKFAKLYRPAD